MCIVNEFGGPEDVKLLGQTIWIIALVILDIPASAHEVRYQERGRVPGLYVRRG